MAARSLFRCGRPLSELLRALVDAPVIRRSLSTHVSLPATETSLPPPLLHPSPPPPSPLVDTFGRRHTYLRLSLTERCNLRCTYCMPAEGVELSSRDALLTASELQRLMALFVAEGVNKLRFTGGEPLVRSDIADVVQAASALKARGVHTVALTTNGLVLSRKLDSLLRAGLTHINVSLDTLHAGKFELISRRPGHDRVLAAIEHCIASGALQSIKLNCVVQRGVNEDELCDFVRLTKDRDVEVRFIEYMPFSGNKYPTTSEHTTITTSQLLTRNLLRHRIHRNNSSDSSN